MSSVMSPNALLDAYRSALRRQDRRQARAKLKRLGYSYRSAAPVLGVHYVHLSQVLNGHRESRRILSAIKNLQEPITQDAP
jgi:hypothetical protein